MTGTELRAIRLKLGLTIIAWGRALGCSGADSSIRVTATRWELSPIVPLHVAKLADMYRRHGVPKSAME